MAQLLTKLKIRSSTSTVTLMKVIKNPVTDYLPMGVKKIGTSSKGKLVHMGEYVKTIGVEKKPLVFVIGAVSIGNPGMEADYIDECISISNFGLSAACVCSKVCFAMEDLWKVI
jgi:rRNA small subunit pseudouridine methyltransferase Nep1